LGSAPILFEQIYSNLVSCICALRSTFCIVSQIFGALYALRPAPTFMKSTPDQLCGLVKLTLAQKFIFLAFRITQIEMTFHFVVILS
jgi:hypothetical protein